MKLGARQKVLWCVLFACTEAGPYLLGVRGEIETFPTSRTYAFVALGMLAGAWATQYPGVAVWFRRPGVWKSLACGGLILTIFLSACNLFALWALPTQGPFPSDETNRWKSVLQGLTGVVGSHESWLAFVAAFVCGVTSVRFTDNGYDASLSPRDGAARCLVLVCAFLAGLLRATAYGALIITPLGIILLLGILFEWSHWLVRCGGMRGAIAALCLGELACRVVSRFGLPLPLSGPGFEGFAFLVSVTCLVAGAVISLRLQNRAACNVDASGGPGAGALESWELERLSDSRLTARELDVLVASINGCDSAEAARRLGVSPSTVRTYKGRICKKLGIDSFDQVIGARSTHMGLFAPTSHVSQPGSRVKDEANRRSVISALLRLAGCLSLFALFLMPFGVLPLFWSSGSTMAYACAAGILLSFVPMLLRRMGLRRLNPTGGRVASAAFFLCAAACLATRLHIRIEVSGLESFQRLSLFAAVAGLVCFGLTVVRSCAGSARLDAGGFGAACACAAGVVVVASFGSLFWLGVVVLSLIAFLAGLVLGKRDEKRPEYSADAHPSVAASWFAVAFVWEECWRGTTYASLQDVGVPFLVIFALLDVLTLFGRKSGGRVACGVVLACVALLCLIRGLVFGLLVGAVLLEVQVLCVQQSVSFARTENRGDQPPALLAATVGCCAAVSVVNAWGSHVLLHAGSSLPVGLGWLVPCCFAVLLAIALWRVVHAGLVFACEGTDVNQVRLEGYLTGKGLTDIETKVSISLARGASMAQIAEELSYSVSAVSAARRSAFFKLGVTTRYQYAALLWRKFGSNLGSNELTVRKNTR